MAKNPATPTDKTDDTSMVVIRTGNTMNLLQTATLDYEIARDGADGIWIRLSGYDGKGYYSKAWINLDKTLTSLEAFSKKQAITSFALKDVYPPNTSCNSWAFLLSVMLAEGLLQPLENNRRRYQLCDPAVFLAEMEKLKASHTSPSKAKPRAKAKASARMPKAKAKPAPGE